MSESYIKNRLRNIHACTCKGPHILRFLDTSAFSCMYRGVSSVLRERFFPGFSRSREDFDTGNTGTGMILNIDVPEFLKILFTA